MQAEVARKKQNLDVVEAAYNRDKKQLEIYQEWHSKEIASGRSALELTWGNCIRENGYWAEEPVAKAGAA